MFWILLPIFINNFCLGQQIKISDRIYVNLDSSDSSESIGALESFTDKQYRAAKKMPGHGAPRHKKSRNRSASSESAEEQTMEVEISLMQSINERLGKLDILVELQKDLRDLRQSLEFSQAQIDDLRKENDSLKGTVFVIQKTLETVTKENKQLRETVLDVQTRSMRDNLIFSGIPERENDDAEQSIREFMCHQLKLSQKSVHEISFLRVHRLGKKGKDKARPIIARFEHFKQKELVRSRGKDLKGTNFWINDHFPAEINDRRRKLTPILREHRIRNHKVSLIVDRLYIDGQLYRDLEITPWLF